MNSVDPVRVEGYKVTAFEIFLQSGKKSPGYVFVPVSSGGHFIGLMRGFEDLLAEGLIDRYPTVRRRSGRGVRASGPGVCGRPRRYTSASTATHTIAHAISNPAPPGGNAVLRMVREHGGLIIAVSDDEILEAQQCSPQGRPLLPARIGRDGAGLLRLAKEKELAPDKIAVLVLTGSGLKAPKALESQPIRSRRPMRLEDLDSVSRAGLC